MSWVTVVTTYSGRVLFSKRLGSRACSAWVGGSDGGCKEDGGIGVCALSRRDHFAQSTEYLSEVKFPVAAEEQMHLCESRNLDDGELRIGWTSDVEAVGDEVKVLQSLPRVPQKAGEMVRERELRRRGERSEASERERRRAKLLSTPQEYVVYEVSNCRGHRVYIGLSTGTAVSHRVRRDWLRSRNEDLTGEYSFQVLSTFEATPSEALLTKASWIRESLARGCVLMNRESVGFARGGKKSGYVYEVVDERGRKVHTGFSSRPQAKEIASLKKKLILRDGYTYRHLKSVEPQTAAAHVEQHLRDRSEGTDDDDE